MMVALISGTACLSEVEPDRARRLATDILQRSYGLRRYGTTIHLLSTTLQQPAVTPQECLTLIDQLIVLRRQVNNGLWFFSRIPPDLTEITWPSGCITRLQSLSMRISEAIITMEMFRHICCALADERISIHTRLLALLPSLRAAYEDVLSQLAGVAERARVAADELEAAEDEEWDEEDDTEEGCADDE